MRSIPFSETGSRLIVDLEAIANNYLKLQEMSGAAECAAVVKANAYGLGIEKIVPQLVKMGVQTFFTAHLFEAIEVRKLSSDTTIYALSGLPPGAAEKFITHNIRPVLNCMEEVIEWTEETGTENRAALHVDTGFNRTGVSMKEAGELAQSSKFEPKLLMSHFACADTPNHTLNGTQLNNFKEIAEHFPSSQKSMANSAAIQSLPQSHFDLVRPGISLYGGNSETNRNLMQPVITLQARIIQVRNVYPGETVGYGATFEVSRPGKIAIISIGYADGFIRSTGNNDKNGLAEVSVKGQICPLVGRVSMDLMAIDVTDVNGKVQRGDLVELIGKQIGVDEVAAHCDTIGYEILTRLGSRFATTYINDNLNE